MASVEHEYELVMSCFGIIDTARPIYDFKAPDDEKAQETLKKTGLLSYNPPQWLIERLPAINILSLACLDKPLKLFLLQKAEGRVVASWRVELVLVEQAK